MLTDVSKVTMLVVDHGSFVSLAQRLGEDCAKVYYCPFSTGSYPTMHDELIGYGLDGIEVVNNPWEVLEKIDVAVFPDVYCGPMQVHFAEKLQIPVWGSRMGERLEIDRVYCKELMAKLGLPVGPYDVIKGVTALREYIKDNPDVHVKMSRYRGDWETKYFDSYFLAKNELDKLEQRLGVLSEITVFVCEKSLEGKIEFGRDNYSVDGKYPKKALLGIEVKDLGYAGMVKDDDDLPEYVHRFDTAIEPTLKRLKFRGNESTEIRMGRDKVPFMIDFCARLANPPSSLYMEQYKNMPEIILAGAQGELKEPDVAAKWGVEAIIYSDTAMEDDPVSVEFPKNLAQFIKFRNLVKVNGHYQVIPTRFHWPQIGSVIGMGNTLKAAEEMAEEIAGEVRGKVKIHTESFGNAQEEIDKAKELGLDIF